ncbi:GntR family transcriptional regulator [Streptomyces uncialis]|uniref:GntR family transcriptional regulator n=1 Tax=Streptomyces uncialis TaxID=1048205 RepID=UPI00225900C9|nr:GntR family transcriptional regulator [Streptomyces uncialis]MCX4664538.1 GntR family transcriptional regulator [Streptomyces uncialis]WST72855.1 GntR family transcriptional regulator [Streptomyces uncialis]WTE15599.1 GntR family transcriptional regulator [Streptomyces uncialis]
MVEFRIDRRSGMATYLQIVQQVKQALRMGILVEGDRLPTAAQVAASTRVNPNTTLKAYRELEREGLVEPRPGVGTFVSQSLARPPSEDGARLTAELVAWMDDARATGMEREDVRALLDATLEQRFPPP